MKNSMKPAATAILALSVAACTSTSGGGITLGEPIKIDPVEDAARVYADKDGTASGNNQDAGGAIADGATLAARKVAVAGQSLDYVNGDTGSTGATASVKKNGDGELTVMLNDQELAFKASERQIDDNDGKIYGYEKADGSALAYNSSGDLDDLLNPGKGYAEILRVQTNQGSTDGSHTKAFAVVGTETRGDALKTMPTATYSGRARLDVVPTEGFVNRENSRIEIRSDMTMTADFGKGEVSGMMNNARIKMPGSSTQTALAGGVTMETAKFDNNGFKGALVASEAFADSAGLTSGSGTYGGAFFGPNAEQVTGALTLNATSDTVGALDGVGYFDAQKN